MTLLSWAGPLYDLGKKFAQDGRCNEAILCFDGAIVSNREHLQGIVMYENFPNHFKGNYCVESVSGDIMNKYLLQLTSKKVISSQK